MLSLMSCRICFEEHGRFISPCKCRGTMKYVHAHCLEEWRRHSINPRSFFQCEQCHHQYTFQRSWCVDVLRSETSYKMLIYLTTALCFFMTFLLLIVALEWYGKGEHSLFMSVTITFRILLRIILQGPYVRGTFFAVVFIKIGLWYALYYTYIIVKHVFDHKLVHFIKNMTDCCSTRLDV